MAEATMGNREWEKRLNKLNIAVLWEVTGRSQQVPTAGVSIRA
jgi:hypothetical protein